MTCALHLGWTPITTLRSARSTFKTISVSEVETSRQRERSLTDRGRCWSTKSNHQRPLPGQKRRQNAQTCGHDLHDKQSLLSRKVVVACYIRKRYLVWSNTRSLVQPSKSDRSAPAHRLAPSFTLHSQLPGTMHVSLGVCPKKATSRLANTGSFDCVAMRHGSRCCGHFWGLSAGATSAHEDP